MTAIESSRRVGGWAGQVKTRVPSGYLGPLNPEQKPIYAPG